MMGFYLVLAIVGALELFIHGSHANFQPMSVNPKSVVMPERMTMRISCTIIQKRGPVIWQRPRDNKLVSFDNQISDQELYRIQEIKTTLPQGVIHTYVLTIFYPRFPRDNGTWICSHFGFHRAKVDLHLFVKPVDPNPVIWPKNGSLLASHQGETHMFECIAHNAYPPVTLLWVRHRGPPVPYDMLPPSHVTSRSGTSSSTAALMLTPAHNGSVFSCVAIHPLFLRKVYTKTVVYNVQLRPIPHPDMASREQRILESSLNSGMLVLVILVVLGPVVVGCVVCHKKMKSKRLKDTKANGNVGNKEGTVSSPQDESLNTLPKTTVEEDDAEASDEEDDTSNLDQLRNTSSIDITLPLSMKKRCLLYLPLLLVFVFLLALLGLHVNLTVSDRALPEGVQILFSQSGLATALDCTNLVTSHKNVIRVIWLRRRQPITIQYSPTLAGPSTPEDLSKLAQLLLTLNMSSALQEFTKTAQQMRGGGMKERIHKVKLGLVVMLNFTDSDNDAYTCVVSTVDKRGDGVVQSTNTFYVTTESPVMLLTKLYTKYIMDQTISLVITLVTISSLLIFVILQIRYRKVPCVGKQ